MLEISVLLCTHNPRQDYIEKVLRSLNTQTLPREKWELIIVDNNSTLPVDQTVNQNIVSSMRVVQEPATGLTNARKRGILESKGKLLVFVDDDNVLEEDYLHKTMERMNEIPFLGVLGAGKIIPEFEVFPSKEKLPFMRSLALRNESRVSFSNEIGYHSAIPFGAGLCVRRSIAKSYILDSAGKPLASILDRNGSTLLSGGDIDLAIYACSKGWLSGVFPELEITHLIPKERIEKEYLIRIAAGHAASGVFLAHLWNLNKKPQNSIVKLLRLLKNYLKSKGLSRKILLAEYKAEYEAKHILRKKFRMTDPTS